MMNETTRGKGHALITGATSGFGIEFAKLLAKDGYNLVLVARDKQRLMEITDDITQAFMVEVLPIEKDLFSPHAAAEIYAELKAKDVQVEILINNAGQGQHGNFVEYDIERDVDMIQLNVTSLVSLSKMFLKDMVMRNHGRVLQVASLLGEFPTPMMAVYAATKAFVLSFSTSLQHELKDTQVTLTALLPGASDTDFFHKAEGEDTKTYRDQTLAKPEDVARDGYDALMAGKARVVSGVKNKIYDAAGVVLPDAAKASMMAKQMKPAASEDGRTQITHGPSAEERERIDSQTGKSHGDYNEHEDHVHDQH